jgi:hypothetical protein
MASNPAAIWVSGYRYLFPQSDITKPDPAFTLKQLVF